MIVYILLLLFLLASLLFVNNKHFAFVVFLVLFLLFVLRDISVGTDTVNYLDIYNGEKDTFSLVKGNEYGYSFINFLVFTYFGDFRFVLCIVSLLILFPLYVSLKKESRFIVLSICFYVSLFYYANSLNIMRQSIAMSFSLLAYTYIDSRKWRHYSIYLFIASLFHTTALFLFPLYFVNKIKVYRFTFILILLLTFYIGSSNAIAPILFWLNAFDLYSVYTDVNLSMQSYSLTRFLLNLLLISILLFADVKDKYIKIFYISVVLLNIFSAVPYIARFAQYLSIVQIILFANIKLINNRYNILFILVLLLYSIVVYLFMLKNNIGEVVPYAFY